MGAALPAIAAVGAIGSLVQGNQANRTARDQLHIQQNAANQQQQLFQQTSPYYAQLLQALGQNAGLGGGAASPYGQTAQQMLGPNATGADYARYQTLSDALNQHLHNAFQNQAFGMGTRGLFGSSIDASGRAALAAEGGMAQTDLQRQSMQDAQNNAQQRLGLLAGALGPGLGAGPMSANIAGNAGQQASQMGQYYGNQASGALNGFLQYQGMQNAMNKYNFGAPTGGNAGSSLVGGGAPVDLGGNYSVQLPSSIR